MAPLSIGNRACLGKVRGLTYNDGISGDDERFEEVKKGPRTICTTFGNSFADPNRQLFDNNVGTSPRRISSTINPARRHIESCCRSWDVSNSIPTASGTKTGDVPIETKREDIPIEISTTCTPPICEKLGLDDEASAVKKHMDKLLAEKEALENEIETLRAVLDKHTRRRLDKQQGFEVKQEVERRKASDEEDARRRHAEEAAKEAQRLERGLCAWWWGLRESEDVMKNFNRHVTCVAIADDIHVYLYEDGGWSYSSGLPDKLHNLLRHRAAFHPAPEYVALGSMNRYYIRFKGGKSRWSGPAGLTQELLHTTRTIGSVAFGEAWETFFVVYTDGSWEWGGNIPDGLLKILKLRKNLSDLKKVTLGPNGEWSLWTQDGCVWMGNCSAALSDAIQPVNGNLTDILFGGHGAFFIRYNE